MRWHWQKERFIPVINVVETVRHLTETAARPVNRDDYKLVQTPQVFDTALLKEAYAQSTLHLLQTTRL